MNLNTNPNPSKTHPAPQSIPSIPSFSDLKAICDRHRFIPPGHDYSLPAVTAAFRRKIECHFKHPSATSSEFSGDHAIWKTTLDTLHHQLNELLQLAPASQTSLPPADAQPAFAAPSAPAPCPPTPNSSCASIPPIHPIVPIPPIPSLPPRPTSEPILPPNIPVPPASSHFIPDKSLEKAQSPTSSHLFAFKPRSNDKLFNLPAAHQEQLMDWLESGLSYPQVVERAALPAPDGLGLQTSRSALSRFYQKYKLTEKLQYAAEDLAASAADSSRDPSAAPADPTAILERLVQSLALQAASEDYSAAQFKTLSQYLQRLKDHQLRQRTLDLHQKRLAFHMQHRHYDIFKDVIAKLPELNKIVAEKDMPANEKLHRGLLEIFGRRAVDSVTEANRAYRENFPNTYHPSAELPADPKDMIPPPTAADSGHLQSINIAKYFGIEPNRPASQSSAPIPASAVPLLKRNSNPPPPGDTLQSQSAPQFEISNLQFEIPLRPNSTPPDIGA